jgi:histidinol-phosphate/aromatic aminotransferase/cobyric acid decarboxylase-like protein
MDELGRGIMRRVCVIREVWPSSTRANGCTICLSRRSVTTDEHVQNSLWLNTNERQEFLNQANARMLRSIDSQANFVMLASEHPMGAGIEKLPIATIVEHFASHDVLPRPFAPLEQYVRVSLGTSAEMRQFWRVWDLMAGHRM